MSRLLNGTNQYIGPAASGGRWNTGMSGPWTTAAWVYPTAARTSAADSLCGIVGENLVAGGNGRILFGMFFGRYDSAPFSTGGAQRFCGGFYTGSAWMGLSDPTAVVLNQWYHVVCTYRQSPSRLFTMYRNGVQVASVVPGSNNAAQTQDPTLLIGRRWDATGGGPYFPGRLAEVAVWNFDLTAGEVASLFAGTAPWNVRIMTPGGRDALQIYFPLFGQVASTETDLGPNGVGVQHFSGPVPQDAHPPIAFPQIMGLREAA